MFLTSSVGAWAWFHINPRMPARYLRLEIQTNLVEFSFVAEPVSEDAMAILSTTNLFNGSFLRDHHDRFTVFAGEWMGKDAREMSVVQHTPDICWIGAGAKPVDLGQPQTTEIDFDGVKVVFECRVFKLAPNEPAELTIWCALASGQVMTEGGRFSGDINDEYERKKLSYHFNRIRAMNMFLQAVKERIPADGSKQFVRLSTSVEGDWRITLAKVKEFGRRWLQAKVVPLSDRK